MDLGGSIPGLPGERGQQLEEGHWQAKCRPGSIIVKSGQVVATQLRPNNLLVLFTRNSSWSKESAMHADLTTGVSITRYFPIIIVIKNSSIL